ncbi:MAG: ATP-binding protein [Streptomyces sp.]|nr:ATP-binding protein [Streptomyces sp.]
MSNNSPSPEVDAPARRFSVQLPSTRRGAQRARLLAVAKLAGWGLPHDCAAHVVAELAANAALHGRVSGREFRLTLDADVPGTLRIEVVDARGERLPAIPRDSGGPDAESGRGLVLVNALAARWGVTSGQFPAKTVWAEVDVAGG